jgi:hypothetical protein
VAEDTPAHPLPQRVPGSKRHAPGDKHGQGTGPVGPSALPEPVLQRIRAALDSMGAEASPQEHAAPAEPPAALSQQVPDARKGPDPPALMTRPKLPASVLRTLPGEAATDPFLALPVAMSTGVAEEIAVQQDTAARPEPATATPADPELPPAQLPPAEGRPDRQDRRDEEPGHRGKAPAHRETNHASPGKAQVRRAKKPARPPNPAPQKTPPPRAKPARPRELARRSRGVAVRVVLVLVLLSAGSLAFLLTRHAGAATAANAHRARAGTEETVRNRAAAWVASQVSRSVTVSCDQVMCQALEAHGIPATSLLVLKPGEAGPPHSGVIVVTAAVSGIAGSRFVAADAPAVIASFGSGNMRISVRVIAQHGAAAYSSALRNDIANRKVAGTGLLQNQRITLSAPAHWQLVDGLVDPRVMLTIANLASQWPVSIVAFGDLGPGASRGIPLRCADLAETGGRTGPSPAAQVRLMSVFLHGLGAFYPDARIQMVRLAGGRNVLRIEFAAPSPLGLLGPPAS